MHLFDEVENKLTAGTHNLKPRECKMCNFISSRYQTITKFTVKYLFCIQLIALSSFLTYQRVFDLTHNISNKWLVIHIWSCAINVSGKTINFHILQFLIFIVNAYLSL